MNNGFPSITPSRVTGIIRVNKGFTLIELLVVISIIALLSSVVLSSVIKARIRARDSARIQNARQIAIALEQYESTFNTYKVANSGLTSNNGSGYVAKSGGSYGTSILSALKSSGLYSNTNLTDPIYGTDNYYLGLCTSTNAYNVFVKMEQSEYNNSTSSIVNACGGAEASSLGFNFIASTAGGASGGGGNGGYTGASDPVAVCGTYSVVGQDGLTYGTVIAEDNMCWLDRNLGATRVANAYNDYQAYGSKFQWGRGNDGHQLINYPNYYSGTSVNGSTTLLSVTNTPLDNLFIKSGNDWLSTRNDSLWQGANGINNPCPTGFHVPTSNEWQTWENVTGLTYASCGAASTCLSVAYGTKLKLPTTGGRERADGVPFWVSSYGYYWTSTIVSSNSNALLFYPTAASPTAGYTRAYGFSVRCIKG